MGKFFKVAQASMPVTEEWFRELSDIKTKAENERKFIPSGDGSPKLMYEGEGLKKFTGKFVNPNELRGVDRNGGLDAKFLKKEKDNPYIQ